MRLSLFGRLKLNASDYEAGLKRMKGATSHWASELGTDLRSQITAAFAPAAVGLLIEETIRGAITRATKTKDRSQQFTITTDEVQRLEVAAMEAGLSFDDFGTALDKMGKARREAVQSSRELREEFAHFGITLEEINDPAMRDIDLLKKLAHAAGGKDMSSAERQFLRDIFGKSGARLAGALEKLNDVDVEIIPKEQIDRVDEAVKKVEALKIKLESIATGPASMLLGGVSDAANGIDDHLRSKPNWFTGLYVRTFGQIFGRGMARDIAEPGVDQASKGIGGALSAAFGGGKSGAKKDVLYEDKIALTEQKELAEAYKKLADEAFKLEVARLKPTEQRVKLQEKITDLEKSAANLKQGSKEWFEAQHEINAAKLQMLGIHTDSSSSPLNVDALTRIGGLGINSDNAVRTSGPMDRLVRSSEETARNTRNNGIGL